jgi:single-strand DNA-binding protein
MLNTVVVDGNVVRDAEVRFAQSGTAVCSWSLAHNTKMGDAKVTHYFDVTALGKLGESCADRAKKGSLCVVYGKLQQRTWEKDGKKYSKVQVLAEHVAFKDKEQKAEGTASAGAPQDDSSDIPF